jgi:hypothetical protein
MFETKKGTFIGAFSPMNNQKLGLSILKYSIIDDTVGAMGNTFEFW